MYKKKRAQSEQKGFCDIRKIEKEDVIKKEKDSLTSLPLVPWVIFLCGVVQFSVNST